MFMNTNIICLAWWINRGIDAFRWENVEASQEINALPDNLEEDCGIGNDLVNLCTNS